MPVRTNEVITVSDTPIGITLSNLKNANGTSKWIKVGTFSVKSAGILLTRQEDVVPDVGANIGLEIPAGTVFRITGEDELVNLRMIKSGEDNAVVYVDLEQV